MHSSIHSASSQAVNALYTYFNSLSTVVFWASSVDYKKQLYVNKAYENIWGRSVEQLRSHPESWVHTLLAADLTTYMAEAKRRSESNESRAIVYRIYRPDGKVMHLKNTNYTLFDSNNLPTIVSGIDEVLTAEEWEKQTKLPIKIEATPLLQQFHTIFQNEFNVIPQDRIDVNAGSQQTNNCLSIIKINGQMINLAKQEARCLKYLLEGRSAKETAYLMKLSTRTVEAYLNNLRRKTSCRSKLALISKIKNSNPCL